MMSSMSPAPNRRSPRQSSPPPLSNHSRNFGSINIDDMFRNIYSDSEPFITLDAGEAAVVTIEDFLAGAGVVNQADLRISQLPAAGIGTAMRAAAGAIPVSQLAAAVGGGGKRRADLEVDEATQQKQRRMIKNRESAARSRERKLAYTVELESVVTQLEEDNARLLREEAEMYKERYKQLMRNIIPVVERRRPQRVIKRVRSMEW